MDPTQVQQIINSNPQIQEALKSDGMFGGQYRHGQATVDARQKIIEAMAAAGVQIPDGYDIDMRTGQLSKDWTTGDYLLHIAGALAPVAGTAIANGVVSGAYAAETSGAGDAASGGGDAATVAAGGGDAAGTATSPTLAELTGNPEGSVVAGSGPIAGTASPTAAGTGSTLSNVAQGGKAISALGQSLGNAANAMGQNNLNQEQLALTGNQQNITEQNNLANQMMQMAYLEESQRNTALKDLYKQSYATSGRASPYDPAGPMKYSPEYMSALQSVAQQGDKMLGSPAKYNASTMQLPQGVAPLDIKNLQASTGTEPSTLQKIYTGVGPGLSAVGTGLTVANDLGWL